jgi:hypothetical protein
MALGAAFKRLSSFHEGDVVRMRAGLAARTAGHDAVHHSAPEGLVTFSRGSEVLWTARAQPMARFSGDTGLLRWWWYGALSAGKSQLDPIVAEGQRFEVEELTKGSVQTESLEQSEVVCALAAHLARAEGLLRLKEGDDWSFFALYDAGGARMSIPSPPVRSSLPPGAARASQSLAPPSPGAPAAPATPGAPAAPPRELVNPVARETMALVQASLPVSWRQALLTVVIDAQAGKARLFLHVAAVDDAGDLQSLDPSQRLFDAVVAMVSEQRRRGGADLRKLVLRLRPTERGASIDLVVA